MCNSLAEDVLNKKRLFNGGIISLVPGICISYQGRIQDFSYVSQSFRMYNLVLRAANARGT
jgi:hypothetical protein